MNKISARAVRGLLVSLAGFVLCPPAGSAFQAYPDLRALLPEIASWELSEKPQAFFPDTLYEYIDGAAESYLAYDFRELLVAQYQKAGSDASLTLEIYDMGLPKNAFGIFGAERYPDNRTVAVGVQGYIEDEVLNFFGGRIYVKLLCFGAGAETEAVLERFARAVAANAGDEEGFPPLLAVFPRDGLIANSEKYILRNFMGYEFLHGGYLADYEKDGKKYSCFLIEGDGEADAETMMSRYTAVFSKDDTPFRSRGAGLHSINRYGEHVYLGRIGSFLYGVMRVPEGMEGVAERSFQALGEALKAHAESRLNGLIPQMEGSRSPV